MRKKLLSVLLLGTMVFSVFAAGCGTMDADKTVSQKKEAAETAETSEETLTETDDPIVVKIGVSSEQNEMWDPIKENLAKEGIQIEIVYFSNYTLINQALDAGEIDLNAFQHYAYMNGQIDEFGYKITAIGETLYSPLNLYSSKIQGVDEIKDGDIIAIPADDVNQGRALLVLQAAGLITVDPNAGSLPLLEDVTENPLNLDIELLDQGLLPSSLDDTTASIINGQYALDAGIVPDEDAIFIKDRDENDAQYVNVIAARTKDADNEIYKRVVDAYHTDEVKDIINNKFHGAYVAAW